MRDWKDDGACVGQDTELFFDAYEEDLDVREIVDRVCFSCPVKRDCLAYGGTKKEYGVWGGLYLIQGKISPEFNNHRTKESLFELYASMTLDR